MSSLYIAGDLLKVTSRLICHPDDNADDLVDVWLETGQHVVVCGRCRDRYTKIDRVRFRTDRGEVLWAFEPVLEAHTERLTP